MEWEEAKAKLIKTGLFPEELIEKIDVVLSSQVDPLEMRNADILHAMMCRLTHGGENDAFPSTCGYYREELVEYCIAMNHENPWQCKDHLRWLSIYRRIKLYLLIDSHEEFLGCLNVALDYTKSMTSVVKMLVAYEELGLPSEILS